MKTRLIGDVHGKFMGYNNLVQDSESSIQVGDMGVGFNSREDEYLKGMILSQRHRFIRGNHDDPAKCKGFRSCIEDGSYEDGVFYVGGAWSIDRAYRTEGVSWWRDEELSYADLSSLVDKHIEKEPSIIISHTAPIEVPMRMGFNIVNSEGSRTEKALSSMLHFHTPKLWVFGHWHQSFDEVINGCRFICLNELEHIDLDLEEYK